MSKDMLENVINEILKNSVVLTKQIKPVKKQIQSPVIDKRLLLNTRGILVRLMRNNEIKINDTLRDVLKSLIKLEIQ